LNLSNTYQFFTIVALLAFSACIERVDLESIANDEALVVDAMITDQIEVQEILISRVVSLTADSSSLPETNAEVWLSDNDLNRIDFVETNPGQYLTEIEFGAVQGSSYTLNITTSDGEQYSSIPETMINTPTIDSVYAEFEPVSTSNNENGGFINFFLDSRTNPTDNKYYRWVWEATYEISVPQPSRWLWTGGNTFIIRERSSINDSLQVELCWNKLESKELNIRELLSGENQIIKQPIYRFHSDSGYIKRQLSMNVKQYAISQESFRFWDLIVKNTDQGSLFDTQVGVVEGNINNINNPEETVLGYFEVVQEQSKRRFFVHQDFRQYGFVRSSQFVVECSDDDLEMTAVDQIGEFMEENKDAYTLCYFITAPPSAVFCRIRCAECTEYSNSNQMPEYWE